VNRAVINSLPEKEFLLIGETLPAELSELTEDELVALHTRVQRARGKYVTNYRREASAKVAVQGGRGKARPKNTLNRDRAEVFEDALARVSRAVAAAARASAAELKAERLAAAAAAKSGVSPTAAVPGGSKVSPARRAPANAAAGDRSLVSPRSLKKGASSQAQGTRRQAKRDAR
jgi:hypothetical protein